MKDPDQFAESLGIRRVDAEIADADVRGWCYQPPARAPTIFVNTRHADNRQPKTRKVTLAHELYHALVDMDSSGGESTMVASLDSERFDYRERAANQFAADVLLPQPLLRQRFQDFGSLSLTRRVESVAAHFDLGQTLVILQAGHALLATRDQLLDSADALGVRQLVKDIFPQPD